MVNDNVSFASFDSSDFATIPESIAHAKSNPILLNNLSDALVIDFEGEMTRVQEPSCTFKELRSFFEGHLKDIEVPESEFYNPSMSAKRIYRSQDLWFTLLIFNNMYSVMDYNKKIIKYLPPNKLTMIAKFIQLSNQNVRVVQDNDITDRNI